MTFKMFSIMPTLRKKRMIEFDKTKIDALCSNAKTAAKNLALLSAQDKNKMLEAIALALKENAKEILIANAQDVANCTKPANIIDRLTLTEARLDAMIQGVKDVIRLEDPIGEVLDSFDAEDGFHITKVRVPLGVVGIIYEARPNVTVDTAALCIKSGNAVVLRGSSDAISSNCALVRVMKAAIKSVGYDSECIQLIEDVTHEGAAYFMTKREYVNVLVPRGSASLIQSAVQNAKIPVIETGTGVCHVYIHRDADIESAKKILINAKTQRNSVCNACESVLIDRALSDRVAEILNELTNCNVLIHADKETLALKSDGVVEATEQDYYTEYLGPEISCKLVDGVEEAVARIEKYGTHHSDAIVTKNAQVAEYFLNHVDSAAVYHNASTRFTDGFVFGFGAELGISTQKIHARGPIGLRELTLYKYRIQGNGEIRK